MRNYIFYLRSINDKYEIRESFSRYAWCKTDNDAYKLAKCILDENQSYTICYYRPVTKEDPECQK